MIARVWPERMLADDKTVADARAIVGTCFMYGPAGPVARSWAFRHVYEGPALVRNGERMAGDSGYVRAGWREYILAAALRERLAGEGS